MPRAECCPPGQTRYLAGLVWPGGPWQLADGIETGGYDHLVILRCTRKLIAIPKTSADPNPAPLSFATPETWSSG
jgi:hypothetical protein